MQVLLQIGVRRVTGLLVIQSVTVRKTGLGAENQHTVKVLEDEFHVLLIYIFICYAQYLHLISYKKEKKKLS